MLENTVAGLRAWPPSREGLVGKDLPEMLRSTRQCAEWDWGAQFAHWADRSGPWGVNLLDIAVLRSAAHDRTALTHAADAAMRAVTGAGAVYADRKIKEHIGE